MSSFSNLQVRLQYVFHDSALLRQALTHRSFGATNNERLEFIGDSVLNLAVASLLYDDGEPSEGQLSYLRASLVREETLASLAQELGIGDCIRLGEGELRSGGSTRPSILADALEAVMGAVYLDGGFDVAHKLAERLYQDRLRALDTHASAKDAKTRLQEMLQGRRLKVPVYTVMAISGPAHQQLFQVRCEVAELALQAQGEGGSRRAGEQQAAELMLNLLLAQSKPARKPNPPSASPQES